MKMLRYGPIRCVMRYQMIQQNGVMQPTAFPTGMPHVTLFLTACKLYLVALVSLTSARVIASDRC